MNNNAETDTSEESSLQKRSNTSNLSNTPPTVTELSNEHKQKKIALDPISSSLSSSSSNVINIPTTIIEHTESEMAVPVITSTSEEVGNTDEADEE